MKAKFDGAEREFRIERKNIPYLESSLGRGMYDVLKDMTNGKWTLLDVAKIVSFALHGPSQEDRVIISTGLQALRLGLSLSAVGERMPMFGRSYAPHPDVIKVLERDGHGNFASLAADILTFTIFGDTAEEVADDDAA